MPTYLCWLRLISWPKVLLHSSHAYGRFPLWDLLVGTHVKIFQVVQLNSISKMVGATAVAQSVKLPERRSLKEVQLNWREFDSSLQSRS